MFSIIITLTFSLEIRTGRQISFLKFADCFLPSDFLANHSLSGRDEYENKKAGKVLEVAQCDF
jgi:hypothetical protein